MVRGAPSRATRWLEPSSPRIEPTAMPRMSRPICSVLACSRSRISGTRLNQVAKPRPVSEKIVNTASRQRMSSGAVLVRAGLPVVIGSRLPEGAEALPQQVGQVVRLVGLPRGLELVGPPPAMADDVLPLVRHPARVARLEPARAHREPGPVAELVRVPHRVHGGLDGPERSRQLGHLVAG